MLQVASTEVECLKRTQLRRGEGLGHNVTSYLPKVIPLSRCSAADCAVIVQCRKQCNFVKYICEGEENVVRVATIWCGAKSRTLWSANNVDQQKS
jgi:hypothetical protein